ncbi:non-ribosomal peptide synthetase [Paenibacillus sp. FJAT-26967]|uniref:non-ribosomal peptide synthetase n=1 Tax=Paenibacillus sp. FJAT-26967 TaxID=1729690 RepID=UPI0008387477|nr:non-ribosomal peptide synthetase [Paenibacillus sp. FJAT-26967]
MERTMAIQAIYNLSPMQEGMLFHHLLNKDSQAYFEQFTCEVTGTLDVAVLQQSFNLLIGKYEILRTNFLHENVKRPKQVVFKERPITIAYEDISGQDEQARKQLIGEHIREDKKRGFHLAKDLLLRLAVWKTGSEAYTLNWSYHHILMDGWCLKTIVDELFDTYRELRQGLPVTLTLTDAAPYANYIKWLDEQDQEEARAFWKEYLAGFETKSALPGNKGNLKENGYTQRDDVFAIPEETAILLERTATENQVTLNTVLQTAWGVLLGRYSGSDDVVFGTVSSGRPAEVEGIDSMVGLFINTIPTRIRFREEQTFAELIRQVQAASGETKEYDYFPLAEVQALSVMKQGLIDHLYGFQNYPVSDESAESLYTEEFRMTEIEDYEQSNYDFNVILTQSRGLEVLFKYNTCVYDEEWVSRIAGHYLNVLRAVAGNASLELKDIEILTPAEKKHLLENFNGKEVSLPADTTVLDLFEAKVEEIPGNTAVVFKGESLTYRELNEQANGMAAYLREQGVGPEKTVAIMLEHSIGMIVGVLAVLKAGAAYLPVDPEYPAERISYMLQDSGAAILLTRRQHVRGRGMNLQVPTLDSDSLVPVLGTHSSNPLRAAGPGHLAYVIYTSGSTGKPKGVMIEHHTLVNMSLWHKSYYGLSELDRCTKYLGFGFDASVSEIFPCLIAGSALYIIPDEIRLDVQRLNAYYEENGITITSFPAAIAEQFMRLENRSLTRLITGGDKLNFYRKTPYKLYNNYGPTENTVCSTSFEVVDEYPNIPIGKPIDNVRAYVLDARKRLLPAGVPGELWLAGASVARGYRNSPELTEEKFTADPFKPGERMYRTGDLVSWLPDGNLEFLGRVDQQVKIRGYRIELGEIESLLLKQKETREAVVTACANSLGDKFLCAYLVLNSGMTTRELKARLAAELPEYMVPAHFVVLDKLPLTPHGKVDRKALPEPDQAAGPGADYVAPRSEAEHKLAVIWHEILGLDVSGIGVNSHFFELGGHSLHAVKLVSAVRKAFQSDLPLTGVFESPLLGEMARMISGGTEMQQGYASIERVHRAEYYPVSPPQRRLFILEQLEEHSTVYNTPSAIRISGELDVERLNRVFQTLVNRHEAFRTSFELVDAEPVQKIKDEVEFAVSFMGRTDESGLAGVLENFVTPFNISKAPLFRAGLVQIAEREHVLLLDFHHLIADGSSVSILVDEWNALYAGRSLPELSIQYKDYAVWHHKLAKDGILKKQEEYWLERFQGELPVLNLPADGPRTQIRSFEGDSLSVRLAPELLKRLHQLAAETGTTFYMVMLAAYGIVLSKYTGQEDIIVGSPAAGRPHSDLEPVIGMFVNTLAMRSYPAAGKNFRDYLQEVKTSTLGAFQNQDYPFDELIELLDIPRDLGRNPLFDTMLVVQNLESGDIRLEGLELKPFDLEAKVSKFELTLTVIEDAEGAELDTEYAAKLFRPDTVKRLIGHYVRVLEEVTADPSVKLGDIDLLTADEQDEIVFAFNRSAAEYDRNRTIPGLFEEQAAKSPDAPAVVSGGAQLTYGELNRLANRQARVLRERGVRPGTVAAITGERTAGTIIAILAILKAGGAYLPIDPSYPVDRIAHMLRDSGAELVLCPAELAQQAREWTALAQSSTLILELDALTGPAGTAGANDGHGAEDASNLPPLGSSQDLAYLIYTSGSTGVPKGVMLEHQGILNLQVFFREQLGILPEDRIVQFASLSFDASAWEMFMALLTGASLHLVPQDTIQDIPLFQKFVAGSGITVATLPPTYVVHLDPEAMPSLRKLITAGSETNRDLVQEWSRRLSYINAYGPTESTICATIWEAPQDGRLPEGPIPIGKPIVNTRVYIVDAGNRPVPIGVTGELCLAGDGLARGYRGNETLTAEKFVPDLFYPGERMYRTGDLARWSRDGSIEYLGRSDHQVKIRGFRIETGEIEAQLLRHEAVEEVLILARKDSFHQDYLCAYVVSGADWTPSVLRSYLAKSLPDYMIPSFFIGLDRMPLTPNGKPDRKALPEPNTLLHSGAEYLAPRTETERKLAAVWQHVLGLERIGVYDNFFDLGGHSLKAASLIAGISREFQTSLPLREVFQSPLLGEMADKIEAAASAGHGYAPVERLQEADFYPVSSGQKRLLILNSLDEAGIAYNMPTILTLSGELDLSRLKEAFHTLVQRHESLRTSFRLEEGEPVQIIHQQVPFAVQFSELETGSEREIEQAVVNFVTPFQLSQAPLFRVSLIRVSGGKHLLLIDMHHIVSDGASVGLLVSEFNRLYRGEQLPELTLTYKDYAGWQARQLQDGSLELQEQFWKRQFEGEIPVLNLPTDDPRPKTQSFEGESLSIRLEGSAGAAVKQLVSETRCTLYMLMLTAYNVLLSKYSGQEDIIVGSPVAGRPQAELEQVIGMFVNTLALRNYPASTKTFRDFLDEVKDRTLSAFENQDFQYEELVDKLKLKRDLSRNPLFDVMLEVQNIDIGDMEMEGLHVTPYSFESTVSKFDMTVSVYEDAEGFTLSVEYAAKLFRKGTMERLLHHLTRILQTVTTNPDIRLADINMLTENEEKVLLTDFNDTKASYPENATLPELFREQAARTPDSTALVYKETTLTYRELSEKTNRLAAVLRDNGVRSGSVVAIVGDRSSDMVIGMLGVMKAGGAYLPIDPEYPQDRLDYVLEDSGAQIVLYQTIYEDKVPAGMKAMALEDEATYRGGEKDLPDWNTSSDLAYVMYTSGSTGKPKGVMVEHRGIVRLVRNTNYVEFKPEDKILQTAAQVFDVSVFEIWGALLNGSELYVVDKFTLLDPYKLGEAIKEYGITMMWLTSPLFNQLSQQKPDMFRPLRYLIVGGDALSPVRINTVRRICPKLTVVNGYGPTENTTFSCCFEINEDYPDNIPIGYPISNSTAYILNAHGKLNPIGVPGELWVGGDGVARGYINKPELTAEKFIPNPFAPGEQLYGTGDLARWLPGGAIEYLGRIDNQVKIRGFRIEIGEIETQILRHEAVKEAAVLIKEQGDQNKFLCAYVVSERAVTDRELKDYLAGQLPDYMIPAVFLFMEKLPLTQNGKVDKKALPEPQQGEWNESGYTAPRNRTERTIADIYSELLGIERISVRANFFELGGHSLKAIRLIARFAELGWPVSIQDVFTHQTPADMAALISRSAVDQVQKIRQKAEAAQFLTGRLGKPVRYLHYYSGSRRYDLLSVEELDESIRRQAEQLIAANIGAEIQPHYIVSGIQPESGPQISAEQFKALTALQEPEEAGIAGILAQIDESQTQFAEGITGGEIVTHYGISPSQRYHLAHKDISGTHISFDHYVDTDLLRGVIHHLICTQEVMRSVLTEEGEQGSWMLLDEPESITLPYLDLSGFGADTRRQVLQAVMENFFIRTHDLVGSLMYRILLVKENLKEYTLLLPFSHAGFDYMSGEIIQNKVRRLYEQFENGEQPQEEKGHTYQDYIAQISKGPSETTDEELVSSLALESFQLQTEKLYQFSRHFDSSGYTVVNFEKDAGQAAGGDAEELWKVAIGITRDFFSEYFGVRHLPVWLTNYGRKYGNESFFETVGECIDYIPVLLNAADDISYSVKDIKFRLDKASRQNINYANLMYNGAMSEAFGQTQLLLKAAFEKFPLNVNYLGEMPELEDTVSGLDLGGVNCDEKDRVVCMVWHSKGKISLTIVLPYLENQEKVRSLLEQVSRSYLFALSTAE